MPSLALGTAQFGLDYGLTNQTGQVHPTVVNQILDLAQTSGICFVDTAQAYGNSESILGSSFPIPNQYRVISKISAQCSDLPYNSDSHKIWQQKLHSSLCNLKVPKLDALLVHSSSDLTRSDSHFLLDWLLSVQSLGLVDRIGVSIYNSSDLDLLPLHDLQVVQLPLSLYDQRLLLDGTIDWLVDKGLSVHARSIFLQGLLATPSANWPAHAPDRLRFHHEKLELWSDTYGLDLIEISIDWIKGLDCLEAAIFGITSLSELLQLLNFWNCDMSCNPFEPSIWAWQYDHDLDLRLWS